jgi:hypothetical protein
MKNFGKQIKGTWTPPPPPLRFKDYTWIYLIVLVKAKQNLWVD